MEASKKKKGGYRKGSGRPKKFNEPSLIYRVRIPKSKKEDFSNYVELKINQYKNEK